jgi:hypothetical protein
LRESVFSWVRRTFFTICIVIELGAHAEPAAHDVALERALELRRDPAAVLEEAVVLRRHDRVDEERRDLIVGREVWVVGPDDDGHRLLLAGRRRRAAWAPRR